MLLILFVPPALMAAAIIVIPPIQKPNLLTRRAVIIAGITLGIFMLVRFSIPPESQQLVIWLIIEIFLLPYLLTGIAGFLLHHGLRASSIILREILTAGALIGLVYIIIVDVTSPGLLSIVFGLLIALACALMGIVIAIWLAWSLKGKRKLTALLPGVVLPMILVAGVSVGDSYSPESITQRNGEAIVEALQRYHTDQGTYPLDLGQLKPAYLPVLPEALTTQGTGWMYQSTSTEFTLGYWYYPDKMGSLVCLTKSSNTDWDCDLNNWGPFPGVPTPGPTLPSLP